MRLSPELRDTPDGSTLPTGLPSGPFTVSLSTKIARRLRSFGWLRGDAEGETWRSSADTAASGNVQIEAET